MYADRMADTLTAPRPLSFRPTREDQRIISNHPDGATAAIREALRLLDHEMWLQQFYKEAEKDANWNPNSEPEAW